MSSKRSADLIAPGVERGVEHSEEIRAAAHKHYETYYAGREGKSTAPLSLSALQDILRRARARG